MIVGPTASGKTDLSLNIARILNAEIVSADSRLFYRGMDIGTAKPSPSDRVRIPHHLIDVADPDQTWTLSLFQQAATEVIQDITQRGRIALLVGGTGQYIQAVLQSWSPPTTPPDMAFRAELENRVTNHGYAQLHEELRQVDPLAAEKIDPRNYRRTIRALEVFRLTGKKFSDLRRVSVSPYNPLTIGLSRPRPDLYARIDSRIESMFSNGFLEEVRTLLAKGYSASLPAMSSIGYWECVQVHQGSLTVEEAKVNMRRRTRIFVRRQANWFKSSDSSIHWFPVEDETEKDILRLVKDFLQAN